MSSPVEGIDPKRFLRARLRAARRKRTAHSRHDNSELIADLLDELLTDGLRDSGIALPPIAPIAAYVATANEPDTQIALSRFRTRGWQVLLPILRPDHDLDWAVEDGQRQVGWSRVTTEPTGPSLGQDAITQAGLILVPALAVDQEGNRLGQGGGSYDRALARARPGVLIIAIVHPEEILDSVPHEPHDRLVHAAITPHGVHWFGPAR
ncbi:MAG: 5-formyltetrahydrofolate cyclo-ligase [Actinomycetota bacterium]